MGKELPAGLVGTARKVGFEWPKADEDQLLRHAQAWFAMQSILSSREFPATLRIFDDNEGEAVEAFRGFWIRRAGHANKVAKAAGGVSAALSIHSSAISTLKTFAITELTMLKDFLDRFNWPGWIGGPDAAEVESQNRRAMIRVQESLQSKRQIAISQIAEAAKTLRMQDDPFGLNELSADIKDLAASVGGFDAKGLPLPEDGIPVGTLTAFNSGTIEGARRQS